MSRLAWLWLALALFAGVARAAPLWQDGLDFDRFTPSPALAAAGDGRVFYLKNNQLVAANLRTGRRLWKYGGELNPTLTLGGGRLYVSSRGGSVYALEARTGKRLWSVQTGSRTGRPLAAGDLIFFTASNPDVYGLALEAATGRTRWRTPDNLRFDRLEPAIETKDKVIWRWSSSGAIPVQGGFVTTDRGTGKVLWKIGLNAEILAVEKERVYVDARKPWDFSGGLKSLPVEVYGRQRAPLKTMRYQLEPGKGRSSTTSAGRIALDQECLWVEVERVGSRAVECHGRDQPDATPRLRYEVGTDLKWVAGPHQARLLFLTRLLEKHVLSDALTTFETEQEAGPLVALDIASGQRTEFRFDGRVARLDLIGNGVFVGLEDGRFLAFDLRTGKLALEARTKARAFGPTLVSGDTVLVQAQRELHAYPLPPSLR